MGEAQSRFRDFTAPSRHSYYTLGYLKKPLIIVKLSYYNIPQQPYDNIPQKPHSNYSGPYLLFGIDGREVAEIACHSVWALQLQIYRV